MCHSPRTWTPGFLWLIILLASVSQADPMITVLSPNGGEVWRRDQAHTVSWGGDSVSGNVRVELYRFTDFNLTISASAPSTGSVVWQIPGNWSAGNNYRVKVTSLQSEALFDFSDAYFTISVPSTITVTSPNGGEDWRIGSSRTISWTDNFSGDLRIDLLRSGALDLNVAAAAANSGSFTWHIADTIAQGADFSIRICNAADSSVSDTSNNPFTLTAPPALHLTSPNGGETFYVGDSALVIWSSVNITGSVRIDLKRTYPSATWETIAVSTPNSSSYAWNVTGPVSNTARVRIFNLSQPSIGDTSDNHFRITNFLSSPIITIFGTPEQCRLRWRTVSGATSYQVWCGPNADGTFERLFTTADTSCLVDPSAVRLFFRVIAEH
jgi:hypothetical protein